MGQRGRKESGAVMRLVWLASYPKSGNTWMRALLANLKTGDDTPSDINRLGRRYGIASSRGLFEDQTLLDSGLLTDDEVDALRPGVHRSWAGLAGQAGDSFVMKCHDAYTRCGDGTPLLGGAEGARGAIVVVRDPRDVALSLADHRGTSVDDAIELICDPLGTIGRTTRSGRAQLRQRLLDWSGHVASWLDQTDIPVHLTRYEDMQADAAAALADVARFTGISATDRQLSKSVRASTFEAMRRTEDAEGFVEARSGTKFFRRGEVGGWRTMLSIDQIGRIERVHGRMMERIHYPRAA
jgi:aryl sulfotransferase